MACARARRESTQSHDVSIFLSHLRRKEAIQPMLLILVHAGLQQRGIPVRFPGPSLLRQAMSRQMRRRHTHPPRPSGNAVERQRSPKATKAWWGSERGVGLLGSWKQNGPRLGPATAL